MTTYTNVFGGSPVQTADVSLNSLAVTEDITLVWPTAFQNTQNFVAHIMNLTPSEGDLTVTLPDATLTSVGTDILFVNMTDIEVSIGLSGGGSLFTLIAQAANYIYLMDNSTTQGTWNSIPFGGGNTAGINTITVTTGAGLTASTTGGFPMRPPGGTINLQLASSLELLANPTGFGGNGFIDWNGTAYTALTMTNSDGNITITNGDGTSGNPVFNLNPTAVTVTGTLTNAAVPVAVAYVAVAPGPVATIHGFGINSITLTDGTAPITITYDNLSSYPVIQITPYNLSGTLTSSYLVNLVTVTSTQAAYYIVDISDAGNSNAPHTITIWKGQA